MHVSMVDVLVVMYSSHVTALMVMMGQNMQSMGQKGNSIRKKEIGITLGTLLRTFYACVIFISIWVTLKL